MSAGPGAQLMLLRTLAETALDAAIPLIGTERSGDEARASLTDSLKSIAAVSPARVRTRSCRGCGLRWWLSPREGSGQVGGAEVCPSPATGARP